MRKVISSSGAPPSYPESGNDAIIHAEFATITQQARADVLSMARRRDLRPFDRGLINLAVILPSYAGAYVNSNALRKRLGLPFQ